jgi:hypothetical protein
VKTNEEQFIMNFKKSTSRYFTPLVGLAAFSWLSFAQAATDCAVQTQIDKEECHALVDFYTSTNGANWKNNTGWNVTNTPRRWKGVSCSDGHVTELNLSKNKLSGSIPESLGKLSKLKDLILHENQLSGSIPESLGKLSNLEVLILHENQLSGSIPESLGKLSNLEGLILHENQLSGSIPESLGNLSNLKVLLLHNNKLCGDIPLSLVNLNKIKTSDPKKIAWCKKESDWAKKQTPCPK